MSVSVPIIGVTCGTTSFEGQTPRFGTNQAYLTAISVAGGIPILLTPAAIENASQVLDRVDGLLLPGGADIDPSFFGASRSAQAEYTDPARDALELECLAQAQRRGMPVFGICRGMQMINVALGGTLIQDIPSEVPLALRHSSPTELGRSHLEHDIQVTPDSWFAETSGATALVVNSLHHQAVGSVAAGLLVTATSEDGIIEGLETEDRRTVSVQCHCEELLELDWARALFEAFVASAAG